MGFGKDNKGVIIRETATITIGALASEAAVKGTSTTTLDNTSFRIIKSEYFVVMTTGFADGDGVILGLANNDLSVAEIAETFTVDGPGDRNESVEAAIANRAVWGLNLFHDHPESGNQVNKYQIDSKPYEKVFRWTFTPAEGWTWFAYNPYGAALTTGAVMKVIAKHYGVWVD